jgi:hypothetical protein
MVIGSHFKFDTAAADELLCISLCAGKKEEDVY